MGGSGDGRGRHVVVWGRTLGARLHSATCWICSAVEDSCGPARASLPVCEASGAQAVSPWPHTGPGPWKGKAHLFSRLPLSSLTRVPHPSSFTLCFCAGQG